MHKKIDQHDAEHKHEHQYDAALNDKKHSHEHSHGHSHGHHEHHHGHSHSHEHHNHEHAKSHGHGNSAKNLQLPIMQKNKKVLTIRANSGLSGDMLLTGLISILELSQAEINDAVKLINVGVLDNSVVFKPKSVNAISGFMSEINLPHEHAHRTLEDIKLIISNSHMSDFAKNLSISAFTLLAKAESEVHGKKIEEVSFHEVGALDSILDMCLSCILFEKLQADYLVCSPLPLSDGAIYCAHGWIPSPAPAVMRLLEGIPVCGFAGKGETITPTAIAMLKAFGAHFGPWPHMLLQKQSLAYGTKVFENAPNGAIFALGKSL